MESTFLQIDLNLLQLQVFILREETTYFFSRQQKCSILWASHLRIVPVEFKVVFTEPLQEDKATRFQQFINLLVVRRLFFRGKMLIDQGGHIKRHSRVLKAAKIPNAVIQVHSHTSG